MEFNNAVLRNAAVENRRGKGGLSQMLKKFGRVIALIALASTQPAGAAAFSVQGATLRDPCGEPLVLRGVNAGIAFPVDPAAKQLGEIAKTGANTVRLTFRWFANRSNPDSVAIALSEAAKHKMVAMPASWDATGNWDQLQLAVDFWAQPAMVSVLRQYEDMILLNIANEAGDFHVDGEKYRAGYTRAVKQLRSAGLHMPLVIDAANWGRRESDILQHAKYLLAEDPDHNLVFSWHPWDNAQPKERYQKAFDAASQAGIALIVGEFANIGIDKKGIIDYQGLMQSASTRGVGWLWWWWYSGKSPDVHAMTADGVFGHWANIGEEIALTSPYSIKANSRRTYYLENRSCKAVQKDVAKPNPPAQLKVAATEGAEVWLFWQDNSTDEKNFDIEVWDERSGSWRLIKVMGPDTISTTVGADVAFLYSLETGSKFNPSLAYATTYRFRVGAYKSRDAISYSEPVTVTTSPDPRTCAGGDGLWGEYYSADHKSQDFNKYDRPSMIRTDPTIRFNWGRGSPDPAHVASDHFQVRWTGAVLPQFTGPYTFYTNSDDFARVFVDGKMIIDNWRGGASGWAIGKIDLVAGKKYPIRVEYREWDYNAKMELQWASGKLQRETIPQCRLFSSAM